MSLGGVELPSSLPTNYEYYTNGGIKRGLSTDKSYFTLNDRNITIYSGAMHYFRVPRAYWRDRLRKMRAAGLNTVETYVPWNLHEPHSGVYDFGNGNDDMSDFLHLEEFLKTAKEEDLLAIVRPGPFICAEYEFGGFPSWLLRDEGLRVRTSESQYMKYVARYFKVLMPILAALQFINGGPIIMFQVENEYGNSGIRDMEYLSELRKLMLDLGIKEVLSTADNPDKDYQGTLKDDLFMTANFGADPKNQLDMFKKLQPGRPLMTMEFWTGGVDYWGAQVANNQTVDVFENVYEGIISYPASVNIYMFHGGTDFMFLNGALNLGIGMEANYQAFVSTYDIFAPISESGDYTEKYFATKKLIEKYNPVKTRLPEVPKVIKPETYSKIKVTQYMEMSDILKTLPPVQSLKVIPMEKLNIYNNSGQNFGYTVYRKTFAEIPANSVLQIEGRVCDSFMLLLNGKLLTPWLEKSADLNKTGTSHVPDPMITLSTDFIKEAVIDIVVENWGRVNIGDYNQSKGLCQGQIKLNNQYIYNWNIFPLEFKKNWANSLTGWKKVLDKTVSSGPALFKGVLTLDNDPKDTFVHMEEWRKGIVLVNGFVIGRYARMGPVQTLYLPAPFLRKGDNDIVVFEHFKFDQYIQFSDRHIYKLY